MSNGLQEAFLSEGVLGASVVVLAIAVWYLFRSLNTEKDRRLEDTKEQLQERYKDRQTLDKFAETIAVLTAKIEGRK